MNCPLCDTPMLMFYKLDKDDARAGQMRAQCNNDECAAANRGVTGIGNSQGEAYSKFCLLLGRKG